ncbi:hypothetical protein ACFSTA_03840 [Ornithinibacillus salinisoli]|uniref:LPXTG cell wall anchor domain-containing protein n=1 Tax=Ornithinibacillus salinisoli TaxID=1848459 RepID=A0ABW4VV03_9BACI
MIQPIDTGTMMLNVIIYILVLASIMGGGIFGGYKLIKKKKEK